MTGRLVHSVLALMMSASLLTAPAYANAQEQSQNQTQTSAPAPAAAPDQQAAPQQTPDAANTAVGQSSGPESGRDLRASFSRDYSKGPRELPNFFTSYLQSNVAPLDLSNTPRVDQLIQNGKLMLRLEDAITLALENNLNINIARYTPWSAETDVLRSKSGQPFIGTPTLEAPTGLGFVPFLSFDPTVTAQFSDTETAIPINNPFLSGVGTSAVTALTAHNLQETLGYSEGFHSGTNLSVTWTNDRQSSTSPENIFNPSFADNITVTLQQQLLNGFGRLPNTRYIVEAKNERQAADYYFSTQVISTIVTTENAYWELVYARENVKVEQAALTTSTKLYNDNQRQLEIGTMAPLDVLTAESEVATDKQNLIVAQTNQLQQQTVLLNDITKKLMDPSLQNVEIIPTTPIENPTNVDTAPLADAVKEAFEKRPELRQSELLLKNAGIEVKVTKSALLPVLSLYGQYESQGLGGTEILPSNPTAFAPSITNPLVNAAGTPILVNGVPVYVGSATAFGSAVTVPGGFSDAQSQIFHNNFPTYTVGLNLTLPIRNRAAQADNARAQIDEREQQVQYLQLQNTIVVGVRNAQIALEQGRAQVEAATKATELAKQTLSAEQKKYQLGASTSYNVILRSRDLTTAQGNELRARANLQEAIVNYYQAIGRTLEANRVTVADMQHSPAAFRTPNIPGSFENVRLLPGTGHPSWMGNQ